MFSTIHRPMTPRITLALAIALSPVGCGDDDPDATPQGETSRGSSEGGEEGEDGGSTDGGSTDGGSSGSSGSGATTEATGTETTASVDSSDGGAPPLVDACLNAEDGAILEQVDEEMIANTCAMQNVGNVEGAVACIEEQTGLSGDCASCFGLTIACVFAECLPQCFDPTSTECLECRAAECDAAFSACSGLVP